MKYVDEFRDDRLARGLVDRIAATATRRWVLMDVCGGQTHSLLRYGIEAALENVVELIHGPGCPVCVTPVESIDFAQRLSCRSEVTLTTFGDMMRVPGSRDTLLGARSRGARVRPVYAPLDAVRLAAESPHEEFVFFAVGFETTAPATALAILQAEKMGLTNFSLLVSHVRVLPAMQVLLESPDHRIDGFLAAGHVCTVTGYEDYHPFAKRFDVPVAVTGFEPIDLLRGILALVEELEAGRCGVVNTYRRSVRPEGNRAAMGAVEKVYEVADQRWRGFGVVPEGGMRLRASYRQFDAAAKFVDSSELPIMERPECRGADVLAGRIKPTACACFGNSCQPAHPLGAPMVSSEGACAAYYLYQSTRVGDTSRLERIDE